MLSANAVDAAQQQPAGSIRGNVQDGDFAAPLAGARVTVVETGQSAITDDQGAFVLRDVPPGKYTLVFTKDGYVRQVRADVETAAGRLTEIDASLAGEFTDMDEFVVQDVLQAGAGTEAALLSLRFESAALMDSVSSELMSRAGASDAASALRLVAGASLQDGKSAVIRGLPDRYVSSQMNGVRLPTADEDKRAVELDQFPATVIESIQVTKTFTPDQQGDASGGAVDVRLRSIPDEPFVQLGSQLGYNTQITGRSDFLTYEGGGVDWWGRDDRDPQLGKLGSDWDGAVGTIEEDAPLDFKMTGGAGGKIELDDGVRIGGLASVFYERDSSFYDDGRNDSLWVENPGDPMTPETVQGTSTDTDFKTALFDVTQASESVRWGALGSVGVETDKHAVGLTYLFTHNAEDTATLAIDTRGKEHFFPGFDPNDPNHPGNDYNNRNIAPYLRLETLEYTERTSATLQLRGKHELPVDDFSLAGLSFKAPTLDWVLADSSADLDQPDKRQFGALWIAPAKHPIFGFVTEPTWYPFKPGANFNLGNLQRIWKTIQEDSSQYSVNLKLPFAQWDGLEGYVKTGVFDDHVDRNFDQDTFSNFGDSGSSYVGDFDDPWSGVFEDEAGHAITASLADVDYRGDQRISAVYGMIDLPLAESISVLGGARRESTEIGIVNDAESQALWLEPGATQPTTLEPGEADVQFSDDVLLPSIGLVYQPVEDLTMRVGYARTIARQTFKELSPIIQQEYLGGPVFVGNPDLTMSSIDNYDLRVDYVPYEGALISASYFDKRVEDPIEYVQRVASFTYTTPVNYPEGELSGVELEVRQHLGQFSDSLHGLSLGANATLIRSEVTLPSTEAAGFDLPEIQAPMSSRDMTSAPEHLYNLYATYDLERTRTQFALFYTVQGDTLVAGAGQTSANFIPSVYAREYGTLNASLSQKLGKYLTLQIQAKNLTNPRIEEVYRSEYIDGDVVKTSYTRGIEYSITLGAKFSF